MSSVVIYGIPGSPYVRMPLLACEEKGVSYRLSPLEFGQHKSPEHLARHPFGRIPALEHGDFKLYEAAAIVRYVDQAFPGPALSSSEPRAQARMNQLMNIADWYVMPSITRGISFNRVVRPQFGWDVIESEVTDALPLARTCVGTLQQFLGTSNYFGGEAPNLADLMLFAHLDFFPLSAEGRDLLAGTGLPAWLERMNARPSAIRTSWARLLKTAAAA
jgi:glutathione S-transferase